ncbi:hypothetical protein EKM01_03690 [Flavobacterium sp. RSP46]|uniref:hypothetical protein n=1 Tax=Flavobacterium sp. RSP46 TaxID=2497486 RepID=UPI000F86151F|nr:hypothetical protein [Flavobacterium sp. RSP46]RTY93211.1 hypothetical protein EKM01_03690 [Flavobacterium sp. RSP46]
MKTTITQESSVDYLMNELQASQTKEDFILSFWMFWAQSVTVNSREFQNVVASTPISNWFMTELKKTENEFRSLISEYPDTQGKDKDWLYIKCVNKLMSRFPKSLLDQAKKPQTIKVAGIRIETSILNQN